MRFSPARFRALCLAASILASGASAFQTTIVRQDEQAVRVRVDASDLRFSPRETAEGLRGLPVSDGATVRQEGSRTWLGAMLQVAVPPGTRPLLRVIRETRLDEDWPAAPRLGGDSLLVQPGGPGRPGLRMLEAGWQRSQKLQRLALDLAVHDADRPEAGWSRLGELEFELVFAPEPREAATLAATRPERMRAWQESPVFETLLDKQVINAASARAWRVDPARLAGEPRQSLSSSAPWLSDEQLVRLMVDQDGLVRVTGRELAQAGVDLDAIEPATLSVWEGGRELPILLEDGFDNRLDPQDGFIFAARKRVGANFPTDFFSPENAYFVTWGHGTGRRFVARGAAPLEGLPERSSQRWVQHFEEDAVWNSLVGVAEPPTEADHWFWRELGAVDIPASFNLLLPLRQPLDTGAGEPPRIRYNVRGEFQAASTGNEHHALVRLDGEWAGDIESWRNAEVTTPWFALDPAALAGKATAQLEFELPLDRGVASDMIRLNWVQLDYTRNLVPFPDGQLRLDAEQLAGANLLLSGLVDAEPLLLSEDGWLLENAVQAGSGALRLCAEGVGGDLFVSGRGQLHSVARIVRHANGHLRDTDQQADMLVVAPARYHEALQDLVDYHSQSMSVKLVDIEDVYSQFNGGKMDAQAVQDFLGYAFNRWQTPAPAYLTLVGRASRANQMVLTRTPRYRTQVPTWWVQASSSGATASDEVYTYLVGADSTFNNAGELVDVEPDTFQDILVGRITVNTVGELEAYLAKHREYREGSVQGPWMETQVMAADDGNGQVFEYGNEFVSRNLVPPAFPVNQLHVRTDSPYHAGALDFIDQFNEGCTILNYNGHGAIGILSSSSLFRATDIRFLSNRGKYPINFAWSCLVAYYDDPDSASMAELLLRKANAGSIAFYGSSAKANTSVDNPLMMNYFYNQYSEERLTLGQIVQLTENNLLQTANTSAVIHMYNLLGDPALLPAFPRNKLLPEPALLSLETGQSASFTLATDPPGLSGTLETTFLPDAFSPLNYQGSNLRRGTQTFSDGQTVTVALPSLSGARECRLLLALNTPQGRAVGQLPIFLNSPYAALGSHSPERGVVGDPLQFRLESPLEVDSVVVRTNLVSHLVVPLTDLGGGVFSGQTGALPAPSDGNYQQLGEEWLAEWNVELEAGAPSFNARGLLYRFQIYDWEPFVDANGNGRWDAGESYTDVDADGQYDPAGEPFVDGDGNGVWSQGESFEDLNENGARDAMVELPGRFVGILENERVQPLDSTLAVRGDAAGLTLGLRWSASANQALDQTSVKAVRRDEGGEVTVFEGRVPAQAGVQDLELPVELAPGAHRLELTLGPLWNGGQALDGLEPLWLSDAFHLLTPAAGSAGDLALDAGSWTTRVPAAALDEPLQFDPAFSDGGRITLREAEQGQPGLGLWEPGAFDLRALDLAPRIPAAGLTRPRPQGATLACRFPTDARFRFPDGIAGDSLPLALARWIPARGLWVVQPGTADSSGGHWTVESRLDLAPGWVLPVALRDAEGPTLATQVAGQWFVPGDLVTQEPVFQLLLSDEDGIDLGEGAGGPELLLDGVAVPAEQVQLGEGTTGVTLQWSPGRQEMGSSHVLTVRARDALGNSTQVETAYRVATDLKLDFFANHPNPFGANTTFAWELTNVPRSLRFEIYTAAGRLVRRIPISNPHIGYDEYTWDGRDQKGRDVANGAYFVRVVADGDSGIDEVHKIARLR